LQDQPMERVYRGLLRSLRSPHARRR
jgi:hypothetical protein